MAGWVWAYPIVEILHMCAIVVVVGSAALVDFRLIGWRLRSMPVAELASELAPWTKAGILGILLTGPLLFVTDPDRYVGNYYFRLKMTCLLLTILFDAFVVRRMRSPRSAAGLWEQRFAGGISLLLWVGVVTGGRGIGIF